MVGVLSKFLGRESRQSRFYFQRCFAFGETDSVGQAKNMCIDCDGGLTECGV